MTEPESGRGKLMLISVKKTMACETDYFTQWFIDYTTFTYTLLNYT